MTDSQGLTNPNLPAPSSGTPIEVALALILRDPPSAGRSKAGTDPEIATGRASKSPSALPEVLVTQRPTGTICAGAWEFPGGKVEPGESGQAAAAREALEEVALIVRPEAQLEVVQHTYPHGTVRLAPWVCRVVPPNQTPQNLSVAAHRWVTLDAIAQLDFLEANAIIVERLRAYLEQPR